MEEYRSVLEACPLFAGIAPGEIEQMLHCMDARLRQFEKGQPVILPGDPAGDIGIVLTGGVQVVLDDFSGTRNILAQMRPGQLFAEAFACAGIQRTPVGVEAVCATKVLFSDYHRVITTCPAACGHHSRMIENMVGILARSNVTLSRKISHISRRTTREKLLSYLWEQSRAAGSRTFLIPYDRQQLADYLCVERSAMSSELSRLQREGVLETHRSSFRLLKKPEETEK